MISLVQINYILALLDERNFQRAADKCFVTQPTLSLQIQKAEKLIGGKLFNRDITPLEPTPFLNAILPQLLLIKQEVNSLQEHIKKEETGKKDRIKIGIIPTVAHYLIPDLFGVFQQQLSDYDIVLEEVRTSELLDKLANRKLDMGILSGPLENSSFQIQKLFVEEIYFYFKTPIKLNSTKDLEGLQPWLLTEGNCLRSQMINFCDLKQLTDQEWNYQGGSIDVLIRMVENYGGYTLIPANFQQNRLDKSKIVKLKKPIPARSIIACYNKRNSKEQALFKLFHAIQSIYNTKSDQKNLELLKWD